MCGCPAMESFEEFCVRSLALLQEKGKFKTKAREPGLPPRVCSVIHFHGRAVLSPLLSTEQRSEMCSHREKAVQLEEDRRNQHRASLLIQDQVILDQVEKSPSHMADNLPVSKSSPASGYALVTDSPGLPRDPGSGLHSNHQSATPCSENPILNGYKPVQGVKAEDRDRIEEDEEEEDISLDSLLRRSREYVKREQNQQESNIVQRTTETSPHHSLAEEDKAHRLMGDPGMEVGFSLHHSPVGLPQIQPPALYDPSPQKSACHAPSFPEPNTILRSPESCNSPKPQRRRPRPVSTGNIHLSFPVDPADLVPRSPGRLGDGAAGADWSVACLGDSVCTGSWNRVTRTENRRSSHCGTSPVQETSNPISASVPASTGHHDHRATGFRRRCHTLDSQPHAHGSDVEHVDRSQERVPRFMAGVTWLTPSRRAPSLPLNQPHQLENLSPSLRRHCVTPELPQIAPREELPDYQAKKTSTALQSTAETQSDDTEESQWRAQALEDMRRRLDEEHALQMSVLLAEQEKEQQRLSLELGETERRLNDQGCARPLSADTGGWNQRSVNKSCPVMSPSCPVLAPIHAPSERPSGHCIGFSSPIPSTVTSPSIQPSVYIWGSRTANKPRGRLSVVLTAEQQRAFCHISAIVRGFLTRRLLKTEKVKHLRQTVVDTQEFISSLQTETSQKRGTYSAQDLSLQERVRAQLRAALYDIHDVFFDMPLGERLALLQQDRELRTERKLRDMEKIKCQKERAALSTATQRSLDRKKRQDGRKEWQGPAHCDESSDSQCFYWRCLRVGESPAQVRKSQQKPKSPTVNRVLKPTQGQNSPLSGQFSRQGSWYKKTPEERVKRSDSLKKQHSVG